VDDVFSSPKCLALVVPVAMRATYVTDREEFAVGTFPVPVAAKSGELVVQMFWASICGSDVHAIYDGFLEPEGVGKSGCPRTRVSA
jgi:L-iditol 2-dehydrogenase